jgi:RHS repeat-associated protein
VHHYLPFGEERPSQIDPTLSDKSFTGHERDTESGLDYMMARYYSSSLGRFMAVDPGYDTALEDPQSWNKYAYTRNNPVKFIDVDGRYVVFPNSSPEFEAQVLGAMESAARNDATGRIQAAYDQIRSSSNAFAIYPGDSEHGHPVSEANATNGVGTGGSFYFQESGYVDSDGRFDTETELAAHMMSHMEDMDSGTLDHSPACSGCPAVTENKAVQMANLTGPKDPKRTYDGKPVRNPTASPRRPGSSSSKPVTGPNLKAKRENQAKAAAAAASP